MSKVSDTKVPRGLRYTPIAALIAVVLYAFTVKFLTSEWMDIVAVGSITFGAAFGVAAIIGFLFGVPRQLQRDGGDQIANGGLLVNTNLEQISDWLTKIIVGVGLIEIGRLASGLNSLADVVILGTRDSDHAFALGLIIYSLADGFLVGYVWTRLELSAKLALADALLRPLPPPSPTPPPPPPPPSPSAASPPSPAPPPSPPSPAPPTPSPSPTSAPSPSPAPSPPPPPPPPPASDVDYAATGRRKPPEHSSRLLVRRRRVWRYVVVVGSMNAGDRVH
jgi:hypothetical protein